MVMLARPWPNPRDPSYYAVEVVYTKKFAFLPTKCTNDTVWLKSYYLKDVYITQGNTMGHATQRPLSEAELIIDKLSGD